MGRPFISEHQENIVHFRRLQSSNDQSIAVHSELVAQIDAQLQELAQVMKTDVLAFNQLVKDANIPAVVVK
jgi:hypothetical protein